MVQWKTFVPQEQHYTFFWGGGGPLMQLYGVVNRRIIDSTSASYPSLLDNLIKNKA